MLCLKFEEVYVGFIMDENKRVGLGTLTWSKAKRKVTGQLAMTHALASHALMTLNFNYLEISQFTLTSITSLCLGRLLSQACAWGRRLLVILCSYIVLYMLLRLDRKKILYQSHVFSILIIK